MSELGRVDVLANNAGMQIEKPCPLLTPEDWDKTLSVELAPYNIRVNGIAPGAIAVYLASEYIKGRRLLSTEGLLSRL